MRPTINTRTPTDRTSRGVRSTKGTSRGAEELHRGLVHPFRTHWHGPFPDLLLPGGAERISKGGEGEDEGGDGFRARNHHTTELLGQES